MIYSKLIKPVLFKQDPEKVHDRTLKLGGFFGKSEIFKKFLSMNYVYKNKKLNIDVLGIHFENPIGLAAGFDKDARLTQILPKIGFGFEEIGSIAGSYCKGNEKPRLFRLPKDEALAVNYGLKSEGAEIISKKLKKNKFDFPVGVSIVRANNKDIVYDIDKGIKDYLKAYKYLKNVGDYLTINISCPNTSDDLAFSESKNFAKLLDEFSKLKIKKPVFIKLKPDFSFKDIDKFLKICNEHDFVKGFVISNLTRDRSNLKSKMEGIKGGLSGKVVSKKSKEMLKYIYSKTKRKYILVGCGGIFTAEDAYEKIRNGASLVQLITGMIYKGPGVIKEINKGLARLMERDGFETIEEVVGIDVK